MSDGESLRLEVIQTTMRKKKKTTTKRMKKKTNNSSSQRGAVVAKMDPILILDRDVESQTEGERIKIDKEIDIKR